MSTASTCIPLHVIILCRECIDCLTYIALNALEILMSSIDSIDIYSNDGTVETPSVSAFQNFLQIENRVNIKKVMGRNMWKCFVSTVLT